MIINFSINSFLCVPCANSYLLWLALQARLTILYLFERRDSLCFFFFSIVTLMAFHRSISRTFWEYEMNLKTLLIVSSILLGAYTVSARPSQRAVKLLNRLQLVSDEVKLKKNQRKAITKRNERALFKKQKICTSHLPSVVKKSEIVHAVPLVDGMSR